MGVVPRLGGTGRLGGADIRGLTPHALVRRGLGFVPQVENIFTRLTVRESLQIAAEILPRVGRIDGRLHVPTVSRHLRLAVRKFESSPWSRKKPP